MFELTKADSQGVNDNINSFIDQYKERGYELQQLACDATRLLSCTSERFEAYKDYGFFKRCWNTFSGKNSEMTRANINDLAEMQKYSWHYLKVIQEREMLTAVSLITVKNNLLTMAVEQADLQQEITKMAVKIGDRLKSLENKIENIAVTQGILIWAGTIDQDDYEEFPEMTRFFKIIKAFYNLKSGDWSNAELKLLKKAIKTCGIDFKKKLTVSQLIKNISSEFYQTGISEFKSIIQIKLMKSESSIPFDFVLNNISIPSYQSLYIVIADYSTFDHVITTLQDSLSCSKEEALSKVLINKIKQSGVNVNVELALYDLAIEILYGFYLTKQLFESGSSDNDSNKPILSDSGERVEVVSSDHNNANAASSIKTEILNTNTMNKRFAVGKDHFLVINNNGSIYAWSDNSFSNNRHGQLGNGTTESQETSAKVLGLPETIKAESVEASDYASFAILEDGSVYAWGSNSGQLGIGTGAADRHACFSEIDQTTPIKIKGLPDGSKAIKVSSDGRDTLLLLDNGTVFMAGQYTKTNIFVNFNLPFKTLDIAIMEGNFFAVAEDGNLYSWRWSYGDVQNPERIEGLLKNRNINSIQSGLSHILILFDDGSLFAWGNNKKGQLGNGTRETEYPTPVMVDFPSKPVRIAACGNHSLTILDNGDVYGWGDNSSCQLGLQDEYYFDFYTTGRIFKTQHCSEVYCCLKPKKIEELTGCSLSEKIPEISGNFDSSFLFYPESSILYQIGENKNIATKISLTEMLKSNG